jgi:protein-tyrosine phosphatase
MNLIRPRLWLGSKSTLDNCMHEVRAAGITAILSVADNVEHSEALMRQFNCVRVSLRDHGEHNPRWLIELAVTALRELMEGGETVLVHCLSGANRAPTVTALYLCTTEYTTFPAAWAELRRLRPQVQEASTVLPQLL